MAQRTLAPGAAFGLAALLAGYGSCVVLQVQTALRPAGPPAPEILLHPLGDGLETAREVDTHVGRAQLRRLCANGRCELLAGRSPGEGFSLLASYPAQRWVGLDLSDEGEPLLRDITDRPPEAPRTHPLARASAYGGFVLGLLALAMVARMRGGLAESIARLVAARPALVTTAGTLRFLDASSPATAHSTTPLPPGAATALHEVRRPGETGPYRERGARWLAVPGARHEAIARLASVRGALGALSVGVVLSGLLAALVSLG